MQPRSWPARLRVPLEGVRTAQQIRFASSARAVRELGLPQTAITTAIEKAVRWFQQHPRKDL